MPSPLRRKRQDAGLRLFDISGRSGICESRLSMLERDLVRPKAKEISAFTAIFGAEAWQLCPGLPQEMNREDQ